MMVSAHNGSLVSGLAGRAVHTTALSLLLALLAATALARASSESQFNSTGFLRVQEQRFVDGSCQDFMYTGWNAYEVMENAMTPEGRAALEQMMIAGRQAGMSVLRFFAHGVDANWVSLRPTADHFNEAALVGIDNAVSLAGKHGLRVIMSFITNWDISPTSPADTKSVYARWSPTAKRPVDFYTDPTVKRYYRETLEKITSRVNTVTGATYRADPTIMAWNLFNEPRCDCDAKLNPYGCTPACTSAIAAWVDEMSRYLKQLDPSHLVTIGEEGFWGWGAPRDDLEANPDYIARASATLALQADPNWKLDQWQHNATFRALATSLGYVKPMDLIWAVASGQNFTNDHMAGAVDLAAFHTWLPNWKRQASVSYFNKWVEQHISDAATTLRKPVVLEEFGQTAALDDASRAASRDPIFRAAYDRLLRSAAEDGALRGVMFWEWKYVDTNPEASVTSFMVQPQDVAFRDIIVPASAQLASVLAQRPLASDCHPLQNGLFSVQTAFARGMADTYFYSVGEKMLAVDEGKPVPTPSGQPFALTTSPNDCATLCAQQPLCDSFSYSTVENRGACYLKSGAKGDVAVNAGGWQTFWRESGRSTATCTDANCAVCLVAGGACLRCAPGFARSRPAPGAPSRCTPCSGFSAAVQAGWSECSASASGPKAVPLSQAPPVDASPPLPAASSVPTPAPTVVPLGVPAVADGSILQPVAPDPTVVFGGSDPAGASPFDAFHHLFPNAFGGAQPGLPLQLPGSP